MVPIRAVFFTGIACGACLQHGRILAVDYFLPFLLRFVFVLEIHVLALDQATDGFAPGAFCPVKFQFRQRHVPPFDS
jgi:hypothetical protein